MEEDSYDLAVDGDRVFTCLVYSGHKYNLRYGQVDAEIGVKESSQTSKRSSNHNDVIVFRKSLMNMTQTYLNTRNRMTVISIATTETETPTYPMMLRERATAGSSGIIGLALRRIPK